MTTKGRFRNKYRLQLREKDHEPMHVHLVGGDVNAKIDPVRGKPCRSGQGQERGRQSRPSGLDWF